MDYEVPQPRNLDESSHRVEPWSTAFFIYCGTSFGLVLIAGLMSGLTVGLLSLDPLNMHILEMEGSEEEKKHASRVRPIIEKHHWLLVTLLLCNAGAMETLPIFLDRVVPSYVAIILSVSFVLIFGEVLPQVSFI